MISTDLEFPKSKLLKRLKKNTILYASFSEIVNGAKDLLTKYSVNYPKYTDHSISHSFTIIKNIELLLDKNNINTLNTDELYILLSSSILHDIGMCIETNKVKELIGANEYKKLKNLYEKENDIEFIRNIHHIISYYFILENFEILKIVDEDYAEVIALIAKAHRKEKIDNFDVYEFKRTVSSGQDFVCMPYLACLVRLADELDITNKRTPEIIQKYYYPDEEKGKLEFEKHKSTTKVSRDGIFIRIKARTDSQETYNALKQMIKKIEKTLNYCQKVIHKIGKFNNKEYKLTPSIVDDEIKTEGFIPKNINFSYNDEFIFKSFISENLYTKSKYAIREIMQNAIDACRLRKMIDGDIYNPEIRVEIDEKYIKFIDNGIGMDEFDIINFFSKIGESYFNNNKIVPEFESIGKFGIGILSYFLICDWFEVETKKAGKDPLKFRVDKSINLNFLFYDEVSNTEHGTTVKIPINFSLPEIFNVFDLHKNIEDFFVNLEIPVRLKAFSHGTKYDSILKFHPNFQNQDLNKISRRVPFPIDKTPKEINIKEISFDGENLECQLYTFYSRDSEGNFKDLSKYNDGISIQLFSKGLRIQKIKSKNLYTLGGFLNFKKNYNINLNKSQITPFNKINESLQNWEIQLLKKFWEETSTLTIEEKQEYSIDFYKNIFRGRSFYSDSRAEEYYQFFKETLYPFTFTNNRFEIVQLETFLNNNSRFLLTPIMGLIDPSKLEDRIELGELSKEYRVKLLIPSFETLLLFLEWIYNSKLLIKVIGGPFQPYLFVDTDQRIRTHSKLFNTYLLLDFENNVKPVFTSIYGANSLFKCLLNKNNPFINFICQNENLINESLKILIKEFFSKIKNTNYPIAIFTDLEREYTEIISRVNSNYNKNFNPSFLP